MASPSSPTAAPQRAVTFEQLLKLRSLEEEVTSHTSQAEKLKPDHDAATAKHESELSKLDKKASESRKRAEDAKKIMENMISEAEAIDAEKIRRSDEIKNDRRVVAYLEARAACLKACETLDEFMAKRGLTVSEIRELESYAAKFIGKPTITIQDDIKDEETATEEEQSQPDEEDDSIIQATAPKKRRVDTVFSVLAEEGQITFDNLAKRVNMTVREVRSQIIQNKHKFRVSGNTVMRIE